MFLVETQRGIKHKETHTTRTQKQENQEDLLGQSRYDVGLLFFS